jgi:hypothetical protein
MDDHSSSVLFSMANQSFDSRPFSTQAQPNILVGVGKLSNFDAIKG